MSNESNINMTTTSSRKSLPDLVFESPTILLKALQQDDVKDEVNVATPKGYTPLAVAICAGRLEAAKNLILHGAKTDYVCPNGETILHTASMSAKPEALEFARLHEPELDINAKDHNGGTPLFYACYDDLFIHIEWLLKEGANPRNVDKNGDTAFHIAARNGARRALRMLLKHLRKDVIEDLLNWRNHNGKSPIQAAADSKTRRIISDYRDRRSLSCWRAFDRWTNEAYMLPGLQKTAGCIVVYFLILQTTSLVFTYLYLLSRYPTGSIVTLAFGGAAYIFYAIAAFSNPGVLPISQSEKDNVPLYDGVPDYLQCIREGNIENTCTSCRIVRPKRARHCAEADRCILRFDHYCVFTHNAVGANNYTRFLMYLVVETVALTAFAICCADFVTHEELSKLLRVAAGLLGANSAFLGLHNWSLIMIHSILISNNLTTNEYMTWWKRRYLVKPDGGFEPRNDKGVCKNVTSTLCHPHRADYNPSGRGDNWPKGSFERGQPPCPMFRCLL